MYMYKVWPARIFKKSVKFVRRNVVEHKFLCILMKAEMLERMLLRVVRRTRQETLTRYKTKKDKSFVTIGQSLATGNDHTKWRQLNEASTCLCVYEVNMYRLNWHTSHILPGESGAYVNKSGMTKCTEHNELNMICMSPCLYSTTKT